MSRSRRPSKQAKARAKSQNRDFWGSIESVPDVVTPIRPAADPSALVRTLGQPPLASHEVIAEHYFRAVYDRAAGLATAIAAGNGLLADPSSDDEDD